MAQLNEYMIKNLLFIDIETATQKQTIEDEDSLHNRLWQAKADNLKNEEGLDWTQLYYERAAIFPEFGKIICISVGVIGKITSLKTDAYKAKVKTFCGVDERDTLFQFFDFIATYDPAKLIMVAHNGKEFDFPYLCKRAIINDLEIPHTLRIAGKKPWEVMHQDTLELWRFGDRSWTSLALLCFALGIASPKETMDGSQVSQAYWNGEIGKICDYCKEDVVALIQCWLKINMYATIPSENIVRV